MHPKQLLQILILTMFIHCCPAQNRDNANVCANINDKNLKIVETIPSYRLFTSLIQGKKYASKTNTPLFFILTNELKPIHEQYIKKLLSNTLFSELTQKSITAVRLDFPLKDDSTENEFKEVAEFVSKYKITKRPLQFMLINNKTGEEVFWANPALDDPALLLKNLSSLLPDKYNGQWIDNFKAAKMISQETGKHILVNFTGSDWCIWCQRLKEEVFEQNIFKKYAKDKLVLVEIDFPRRKKLSPQKSIENKKLAEKFMIRGYPSIVILDSNGTIRGKTGYVPGGVEEFINGLKQMMEN